MSTTKKITVEDLRALIMEAIDEDTGIADAEDQEAEHEEQQDMNAATADMKSSNESTKVSNDVLLERWKKLAGIIKGQLTLFAVWYKEDSSREFITGLSSSRKTAYKMAKDLYAVKKNIDKSTNLVTGVFFMDDNVLYTSIKPRTAQVLPLLTSLN